MWANDNQQWPTMINAGAGPCWPTIADDDQQWPTMVNAGQHILTFVYSITTTATTTPNTGQRQPTMADDGQCWPMQANDG